MTPTFKNPALPTIALIAAMILWSSSFIALKIAFRSYDPMFVIFGRMLVASFCFLLIARPIVRALDYQKGDYKLILFMTSCEPCLYFIFEAKAVANTTASQAGIITSLLPIMVMVSAALMLKEKITRKAWSGSLLAVAGACWLTLASSPSENAPNPILGNFLEFLAMVCATGYTISLKSLSSRYSPIFLTAIQAFVGSIFYFPLLFLPSTTLPDQFYLIPGFAIVYLGGVITPGAYGLYNFGVKHLPASRAGAFVNLIPVFAVLLGWLVLGESLTLIQCFAGCLIMAGIYLSQK